LSETLYSWHSAVLRSCYVVIVYIAETGSQSDDAASDDLSLAGRIPLLGMSQA